LIKIKVDYRVKVIDNKTGKIVKVVKGKSKTFNLNFSRIVGIVMFPVGDVTRSISVNDTGGVARTFAAPYGLSPMAYSPAAGYKQRLGIGSSSVAFSRTHYELQAKIGDFPYSTHTLTDDGTQVRVDISGSYLNPGASITVREIALYGYFYDNGGFVRYLMLARDVITDTIVGTNQTISVGYTITVPF